MSSPRRLRAAAAACVVILTGGVANAQTVIVRNAPPAATIEVLLNDTKFPAVTADTSGDATIAIALPANLTETDVHIFTEACGNTRRVLLVERGLQPPASPQPCDRRDVFGFFLTRPVTTFVVDLEKPDPVVNIRQGPVPPRWLARGEAAEESHINLPPAPKGLVLFGGAGFAMSSDVAAVICGTLATCEANDFNSSFAIGATYWVKPFLGAQVAYLRPSDVTANGTSDIYRFNSTRKMDLLTLAGTAAATFGGVRLYAQGGTNYHRATLSTTETIDDVTLTVNDVAQIVKGGTQSFELKTAGWGWLAGGGIEIWVKPALAFYIDVARVRLQGGAVGGGEGAMDDNMTYVMFGARVHIGR
jgi:hypothetical protein